MTKFEVGKKYVYTGSNKNLKYTCVFVNTSVMVAERDGCSITSFAPTFNLWTEVPPPPPPLTFGDLKLGEKFRWKTSKAIVMKTQSLGAPYAFGYVYLDNILTTAGSYSSGRNPALNSEEVERVV